MTINVFTFIFFKNHNLPLKKLQYVLKPEGISRDYAT